MAIDYRDLLLRYIAHVSHEEGATFIPWPGIDGFTNEEVEELEKLDKESMTTPTRSE